MKWALHLQMRILNVVHMEMGRNYICQMGRFSPASSYTWLNDSTWLFVIPAHVHTIYFLTETLLFSLVIPFFCCLYNIKYRCVWSEESRDQKLDSEIRPSTNDGSDVIEVMSDIRMSLTLRELHHLHKLQYIGNKTECSYFNAKDTLRSFGA